MTTMTIQKKEYRDLLRKKERVNKELRLFFLNKPTVFEDSNDLLNVAKLKIQGGPKDISANLDNYLYV